MVLRDKKLIYFFIYWIIYNGLIIRYIFPHPIISLLPDIIVFFLSLKYLLHKNLHISIIGEGYKPLIITILACGIIGSILGNNNIIAFLWGTRVHIRYLLLFCLLYLYWTPNDILKTKHIIQNAFLINIPIVFFQETIQGLYGDSIGGSFINNLGITLLIIISLLFYSFDYFSKQITLKKYIIIVGSSFYMSILAEIKFLYFLIPLIIIGTYTLIKRISFKYIITIILCYFLTIPIITSILSLYYDDNYVEGVFNIEKMEEYNNNSYGFMEGGFNRGTAIELTNKVILTTPTLKLFGTGIGSGSQAVWTNAPSYKKYYNTTFFFFTTSLALTELGWIGSIAYYCIFLLFLFNFYKFFKKKRKAIKYWAGLGIMICLITFCLIYYTAGVYTDFYLFYLSFAMCFISIKYLKNEKY